MYCSAVDTTLRAEALAEVVLMTGQVVRVGAVRREGRGALGGMSALRLEKAEDREPPPPKCSPIPIRYSIPRTNCESAGVAGAARCRERASAFTESSRPRASCRPPP